MKRVAILAVPPSQELNIIGPLSVFSLANQHASKSPSGDPFYSVELVSAGAALKVNGQSGYSLLASQTYRDLTGPIDTLLVAGGEGARQGTTPEFLAWLRDRSQTVRRFGSLCSGAFVLADAGLLRGSRVTTHWKYCAELALMYPDLTVDSGRIWVYDNNVYTSAGVTSGVDLALAMVEEDLGSATALELARYLVMFLRRPSGQTQLSVALSAQSTDRLEFRQLSTWISHHLRDDLRVEALAERVGMSDRNFTRMFSREIGMGPAQFVERTRLERARHELETTTATLDEVAERCGYAGGEILRRALVRNLGLTPSQYRASLAAKSRRVPA